MKQVRWTGHALQNLIDREIDRAIVELTLAEPEHEADDPPGRRIFMRRYDDATLNSPMLLRVVIEDASAELVVVTVYKTSQIQRYLKGLKS